MADFNLSSLLNLPSQEEEDDEQVIGQTPDNGLSQEAQDFYANIQDEPEEDLGVARFFESILDFPAFAVSGTRREQGSRQFNKAAGRASELVDFLKIVEGNVDADGMVTPAGKMELERKRNEFLGQRKITGDDSSLVDKKVKKVLEGQSAKSILESSRKNIQTQLDEAKSKLFLSDLYAPEQAEATKALLTDDATLKEAVGVATSGEAMVKLMSESFIPSAIILGGAVAGGVAGSIVPGGGTTAGAAVGAMLASSNLEARHALLESMLDSGVDVFDVDAIAGFMHQNPEEIQEMVSNAEKQGAAVGGLDAAAVLSGGVFLNQAAKTAARTQRIGRKLTSLAGRTTAEAVTQGTLGAAGAGLGQIVQGKEADPAEMILEFLGEIGGGFAGEVAVGTAVRAIDRVTGKPKEDTVEDVINEVNEATPSEETGTTEDIDDDVLITEEEAAELTGEEAANVEKLAADLDPEASAESVGSLLRATVETKKKERTQKEVKKAISAATDEAGTVNVAQLEENAKGTPAESVENKALEKARIENPDAVKMPVTEEEEVIDEGIPESETVSTEDVEALGLEMEERADRIADTLEGLGGLDVDLAAGLGKALGFELEADLIPEAHRQKVAEFVEDNEAEHVAKAMRGEIEFAATETDRIEQEETKAADDELKAEAEKRGAKAEAVVGQADNLIAQKEREDALAQPLRPKAIPVKEKPGAVDLELTEKEMKHQRKEEKRLARERGKVIQNTINTALSAMRRFTHKSNGGSNAKYQWDLVDVNDDGVYTLTKSELDANGKATGRYLAYAVDFVKGTNELVEENGLTSSKKKLPHSANGIWSSLIRAHKSVLKGERNRFNREQLLHVGLPVAVTRQEAIENAKKDAHAAAVNIQSLRDKISAAQAAREVALAAVVNARETMRGLAPGTPNSGLVFQIEKQSKAAGEASRLQRRLEGQLNEAERTYVTPSQAVKNAQQAQSKMIRDLQEANQGELREVTKQIPERPAEEGIGVRTFMTNEDRTVVQGSLLSRSTAIQVLPDGSTRTLSLRSPQDTVTEKGDRKRIPYEAVVTWVSGLGKLKTPKSIGPTKFMLDRRKVSKLAERDKKAEKEKTAADIAEAKLNIATSRANAQKAKSLTDKEGKALDTPGKTNIQGKSSTQDVAQLARLNRILVKDRLRRNELEAEVLAATDETSGADVEVSQETVDELSDVMERIAQTEGSIALLKRAKSRAGDTLAAGVDEAARFEEAPELTANDFRPQGTLDLNFPDEFRALKEEEIRAEEKKVKAAQKESAERLLNNVKNPPASAVAIGEMDGRPNPAIGTIFRMKATALTSMFSQAELKTLAKAMGSRVTGSKAVIADGLKARALDLMNQHKEFANAADKAALEQEIADAEPTVEQKVESIRAAQALQRDENYTPASEKYAETSEGRSIYNVQYLVDIRDHLIKKGFGEKAIGQVLADVVSKQGSPRVRAAQNFVVQKLVTMGRGEMTRTTAAEATLQQELEDLRKTQIAKRATGVSTSEVAQLAEAWGANAEGLTPAAIESGIKTYEGVTEFARTPAFLDETKDSRTLSEIQQEISRLRRTIRGEATEGTLTTPERVEAEQTPPTEDVDAINDLEVAVDRAVDSATSLADQIARLEADIAEESPRPKGEAPAKEPTPTPVAPEEELAPEDKPLDAEVPVDELLPEESTPTGEQIREQQRESLKPQTEAELEAGLKGEQPARVVKQEQQNVRTNHVSDSENFERPTQAARTSRTAKFLDAISRGFRRAVLPRGSLSKKLIGIRDTFFKHRAAVNRDKVEMERFQANLLHLFAKHGLAGNKNKTQRIKMQRAIVDRHEGMAEINILAEHGVTIPDEIKQLVDRATVLLGNLQREAVAKDAVPLYLKNAIEKTGATWLHKMFRTSPSVLKAVDQLKSSKTASETIKDIGGKDQPFWATIQYAAQIAYSLPSSPKEMALIPTETLRAMIGTDRPIKATTHPTKANDFTLGIEVIQKKDGKPKLDKNGVAKTRPIALSKATRPQLLEYLNKERHNWDETAIENYTTAVLDNIFSPNASQQQAAAADSGDRSITRKRGLMTSQAQQISNMIESIAANENADPDFVKALRARKDELKGLSRRQFQEEVKKAQPDLGFMIDRTAAEFDIMDVVREALGEVVDPGVLFVDSYTRLSSLVNMSKAMTEAIEIGVASGELAIDKRNRDPNKHTMQLGFTGKFDAQGNAVPIPSLGSTQFQHDGSTFTVSDGGARVFGTPDTIVAMHDILNARIGMDNGGVVQTLYGLSSLSKYDKVIMNPVAWPRNATGSAQIGIARGVLGGVISNPLTEIFSTESSFMLGTKLAVSELRAAATRGQAVKAARSVMSQPMLAELQLVLADKGVYHDAAKAGAVVDLFAHMQTVSGNEFYSLIGDQTMMAINDQGAIEIVGAGPVAEAAASVAVGAPRFAGEAFRLGDEAIKGVAFLQRTKQFMGLLSTDSISKKHAGNLLSTYLNPETRGELTTEDLELLERSMEMASQNVRATFPTFSEAPPGVRALSRNALIGAFPTFHYEQIRNTINNYTFISQLHLGILPDGTQLEGKARVRAMALGVGLMAQQVAWNLGSTAGVGAINLLATKHGGGDEPEEKDFSAAYFEALGNPAAAISVYPYRNVMPGYFKDTTMMIVPSSVSHEDGTFQWVNVGWSAPEGALQEAGFKVYNDLTQILADTSHTDDFKMLMAAELLHSVAEASLSVFGNEEVLFRSVYDNLMEKDGLTPDTLKSPTRYVSRFLNQTLRGMTESTELARRDDPTGALPRLGAAVVSGVIPNVPGSMVLSQLQKGIKGSIDNVAAAEGGVDFMAKMTKDLVPIMTGIRVNEYNYREDYPLTLKYDKIKSLRNATTRMQNILFAPDIEYTEKEFKDMFKLKDKHRERAFEDIANGVEFGFQVMGLTEGDMAEVFRTATGNQDASTVGGFDFNDYLSHGYRSTSLRGKVSEIADHWEEAGSEYDLDERLTWYEDAVLERELER
jgi:hypothetical protein